MVARIERSEIRDGERRGIVPDFASLNPGYVLARPTTSYVLRATRSLARATRRRSIADLADLRSPALSQRFPEHVAVPPAFKVPLFGHLVPGRDCADASEMAAAVTIATDAAKRQILVMARVLLKLALALPEPPRCLGGSVADACLIYSPAGSELFQSLGRSCGRSSMVERQLPKIVSLAAYSSRQSGLLRSAELTHAY